jgi:metal-responsive CopG/Arc/MetJ family transcriptional regulator
MSRGYKYLMTCSLQPDLVKELDALKGEDVPRSRFVERVLNQYVESRKNKKERPQSASSVVQAPEAPACREAINSGDESQADGNM